MAVSFTVGRKLFIGFGSSVLLLVLIASFGIYRMQRIEERITEIVDINNAEARLAMAMRSTITQVTVANRNIVLSETPEQMHAEYDRMKVLRTRYDDAEAKLAKMFAELPQTTPEELAIFRRAAEYKVPVRQLNDQVLALSLAGNKAEAAALLMKQVAKPQSAWIATLTELTTLEDRLTDEAATAARADQTRAMREMLSLCGLALVAAIASGLFIGRGLLRQLGGEPATVAQLAHQIAEGNLTTPVPVRDGDTSSLLYAMARMRDGLSSLVTTIRAGADSIATGSSQIAAGNSDLSHRTESQASSLQETAASMEQLTAAVQRNAEAARSAAGLASRTQACAQSGSEVVQRVRTSMDDISAASARIQDIIGVIDGIAFQTNILALNAAVEAARAGEQGRGFAVVAGEVRGLAGRCAQAAREVRQVIADSAGKIGAGSAHTAEAAAQMDEILANVTQVSALIDDIGTASAEQSQGIGQIGAAVAQLDEVTQHNAALVEESAAAAHSLRHQADRLVGSVAVFRTDGAVDDPAHALPASTGRQNAKKQHAMGIFQTAH